MKFTSAAAATILAVCVSASPTPTVEGVLDARAIEKRATITDAANIGYAQQNGGYVPLNIQEINSPLLIP